MVTQETLEFPSSYVTWNEQLHKDQVSLTENQKLAE